MTHRYVALKLTKKNCPNFSREKQIFEAIKPHENIIGYLEAFETNNFSVLVLEYCEGGDLYNVLKHANRLPKPQMKAFALQILSAMEHLHSLGIIMKDLKPENVLLTASDGG
jgi:serine/threonine protein kinase